MTTDTTILLTVLLIAKTIVLFAAIFYTLVLIRNTGVLAGTVSKGHSYDWAANLIYAPTIAWTAFYLLNQINL